MSEPAAVRPHWSRNVSTVLVATHSVVLIAVGRVDSVSDIEDDGMTRFIGQLGVAYGVLLGLCAVGAIVYARRSSPGSTRSRARLGNPVSRRCSGGCLVIRPFGRCGVRTLSAV
ncbi:hypothetical protein [Stackebrandtia soli]|uniref:hypothetical protein n=1 Tax=Stackebrandtia soli TaxID=1892856 RepID=UPI0039E91252